MNEKDVPFIKGLHYLNKSQKDYYYNNVENYPTLNIIKILIHNFDNWLGYKIRGR